MQPGGVVVHIYLYMYNCMPNNTGMEILCTHLYTVLQLLPSTYVQTTLSRNTKSYYICRHSRLTGAVDTSGDKSNNSSFSSSVAGSGAVCSILMASYTASVASWWVRFSIKPSNSGSQNTMAKRWPASNSSSSAEICRLERKWKSLHACCLCFHLVENWRNEQ